MGIAYNTSIVNDGLVFYLDAANPRCYSGSGLTTFDLLSSGIGGTLVNSVAFGSTNYGSFNFDGINDYIQIPVSFIPTTNQTTVSLWNYGITAISASIFYASDASDQRTYNIHLPWSDSVVYWDCGFSAGSYDRINTATLSASQWQGWHNWVFTKNVTSGIMQIYLDGVLNVSGTGKNKALPSISQAFIGRFQIASPAYADSRVSNIQMYNRALSAAEVKTNFNATKKRYGL